MKKILLFWTMFIIVSLIVSAIFVPGSWTMVLALTMPFWVLPLAWVLSAITTLIAAVVATTIRMIKTIIYTRRMKKGN